MQDTDITIKVLNVQDGDAIISHLRKSTGDLLVLIDGGHPADAETVIEALSPFLKLTGRSAPDLVICTHYDSDHIGGLDKIIRHYTTDIKEIWIHETTQVLNITKERKVPDSKSILPSEDDLIIGVSDEFIENVKDDEMTRLLESIKQERELIALIKELGIPSKEPIADSCFMEGWQEIIVLGPTHEYYKQLFPAHFSTATYLENELKVETQLLQAPSSKITDPCKKLDSYSKVGVSATNLNSAIIKIIVKDKSYLFTADAGIKSFMNIPSYEKALKDIHWLKVPHHGSFKNLDCHLITLMNAKTAVVSGDRRIDNSIIGCLEQYGATVMTTRDAGDLTFNG